FTSTLICAAALGIAAASAAAAADIPVPIHKAPAHVPGYGWTGFYIGGNIGYGWADVSVDPLPSQRLTGVVGGGQLGYNWQTGNLVFGVEADFQGSAQKRTDSATVGGIGFTVDQKIPWFATVRARGGFVVDRAFLYATGGWAYINYKMDISALGTTVSSSTSKSGWVVGGGVEWALWDRWTAKFEYLYMDTGSTSTTLFGVTFNARVKDQIARVGVNYRF